MACLGLAFGGFMRVVKGDGYNDGRIKETPGLTSIVEIALEIGQSVLKNYLPLNVIQGGNVADWRLVPLSPMKRSQNHNIWGSCLICLG